MLGPIGAILAICLFIFLVFKGFHAAYSACFCALIIIVTNAMSVNEAYTQFFTGGIANVKNMWFFFVFGILMAEIYGNSGAGASIVETVFKLTSSLGTTPQRRRLIGIITIYGVGVLMLFGGFEAGALPFMLLPVATAVFAQCDIPRRLLPGMLLGTAATIGSSMPGSPQTHNQLASDILGTPGTAALIPGVISALTCAVLIVAYMTVSANRAGTRGEHFDYGPLPQTTDTEKKKPNVIISIIPLVSIFLLYNFTSIHLYVIMMIATVLSLVLFWKHMFNGNWREIRSSLNNCLVRSGKNMLVFASVQGFAAVFSNSPSFQPILDGLVSIPAPPMVGLILAMGLIAFSMSQAPGALRFGLPILGPIYTNMGLSAAAIHRVSIFAAITLDTMPTNGGAIFMCEMCGVEMKDGYPPIGVNTVLINLIGAILCAVLCTLFPGLA